MEKRSADDENGERDNDILDVIRNRNAALGQDIVLPRPTEKECENTTKTKRVTGEGHPVAKEDSKMNDSSVHTSIGTTPTVTTVGNSWCKIRNLDLNWDES